jgi:glyoxylase-like metal-dependent hydrolase (beta-lactamase superfamily II)
LARCNATARFSSTPWRGKRSSSIPATRRSESSPCSGTRICGPWRCFTLTPTSTTSEALPASRGRRKLRSDFIRRTGRSTTLFRSRRRCSDSRPRLRFGAFYLRAIHTPGHTPGSTCFLLEDGPPILFSGDTLFRRSIGRTDLWGGDTDQIVASIRGRLFSLPGATPVVCGHGPDTTIGEERRANPFVGEKK